MPPKVKAAKRVKQDAERVSHPVVEAPLPGTKELTGFLSLLVNRSISRRSSPQLADRLMIAAGDSHGSASPLRAVWSDAIIGDVESSHEYRQRERDDHLSQALSQSPRQGRRRSPRHSLARLEKGESVAELLALCSAPCCRCLLMEGQ